MAAASSVAGYGAESTGTTKAALYKARRLASRAVHGGTSRAAHEVVLNILPRPWHVDPAAVEVIQPLLSLAKRLRTGISPHELWDIAWAGGSSLTGGPTGHIRQALKLLGLEEDALHWYDDDGNWNPAREGIKATETWLVSRWTQQQAKNLANRRPASFGHLSTGCDIQLTRTG